MNINNKIFLGIFLGLLVLVSFVGAEGIIIPYPDTTPPIISNVRTIQLCWEEGGICGPLFVVWDTDEYSCFNSVEYGRGKKYNEKISENYCNTNLSITPALTYPHALLLDLEEPGNYHYKVQSCDMFGNCAYSEDYKVKK